MMAEKAGGGFNAFFTAEFRNFTLFFPFQPVKWILEGCAA
jgi:hypothetical protein